MRRFLSESFQVVGTNMADEFATRHKTKRLGPIDEQGKCVGYALGEFSGGNRDVPRGSADPLERLAHEA